MTVGANARPRKATQLFVCLLLPLLAAGCRYPKDPENTLEQVRGGTLHAGVVHAPPWVSAATGPPSGPEAELLRRIAADLDATIEWHAGPPDQVLKLLEERLLAVAIGGFEKKSPYAKKAAATRHYGETEWWIVGDGAPVPGRLEGREVRIEHGDAALQVKKADAKPVLPGEGSAAKLLAVPVLPGERAPSAGDAYFLGRTQHVFLAPPGENAWLVELDKALKRLDPGRKKRDPRKKEDKS